MKIKFAATLRGYNKKNLSKDIVAGIIIAAVSIPISMGYAQISGLPAVYGLYGSVFPIIVFALFSTSPQFIFGVDAAPAALVGSAIVALGIESGTKAAMTAIPVMTFFVAAWLLVFYFIRVGKLVNYISMPVMGGFISGICVTIILMQIPKLLGGTAGVGELPELAEHIWETLKCVNGPSLIMGAVALAVLLIFKRIVPKFPMAVVLMAAGAIMTACLPVHDWGIQTLSAVETGLPKWGVPDFTAFPITKIVTTSLSVAVVIMAETLLAENNFAQKNGYKIKDNQELLAFSLGNFVAAFTGCCPINGSVSRTSMSEQFQGKTQLKGIIAGLVMIVLLLCGTGFIGYLPIPVLTATVISALIGATEFHIAKRLWKASRKELAIFVGAFVGVLMLGTITGVLIGIILSFVEMVLRQARPVTAFRGVKPGYKDIRDISEGDEVYPIKGVVIYKFSSSLFFANVDIFQKEIERSIKDDTKAVIIDASGVGSIDITAADRLEAVYKTLKVKGIRFYITEHIASLNEQMRSMGLGYMIEEGVARKTVKTALRDMEMMSPYPLEGTENVEHVNIIKKEIGNKLHEFTWAFGSDSEKYIEKQINRQIENLKKTGNIEQLILGSWKYKDEFDEDIWLEHLEEHLREIVRISGSDEQALAERIEQHRKTIFERIRQEHPELAEKFAERRHLMDEHLKDVKPEIYELILKIREKNKNNNS